MTRWPCAGWRGVCRVWLAWLLGLVVGVSATPAPVRADDRPAIAIGVLSIQSESLERERWGAVQRTLEQALPQYRVQWQLLRFPALDHVLGAHRLDAVITNPGHALALQHLDGGMPIASVVRQAGGHEVAALAGVAWVRADSPLHTWADLVGRRVAFVSQEALGGRWLQSYELHRRGIGQERIDWVPAGPGHDSVIDAVLQGQADVAFVRAGIWEARVANGQPNPDALRPLQPQKLPGYPFAASTPLYPDWAVLTLPSASDTVARDLAAALLSIRLPAAERAALPDDAVVGFAPPRSSAAVERVLRTFHVRPFGKPPLTWAERLQAAAPLLLAAAAGLVALAGVAAVLWRQKRRLRQLLDEEAIQARVFDSDLGVMVTDANNRIVRVNAAFTRLTGYSAAEAIGQTPSLLQSGQQDAAFYQAMWDTLSQTGTWQGEIWNRRKNGEIYPEWLTISTVRGGDGGVRHYVAVFTDLSWRKAAEAQIEHLASHDVLTGHLNRHGLLRQLHAAVDHAGRQQRHGALLLVDLDQFRLVNDTHGPGTGDAVLSACAQRLQAALQPDDWLARLAGDEFAMLLWPRHDGSHLAAFAARAVAEQCLSALRQPFELPDGASVTMTASVGIALVGTSDRAPADWLTAADQAMQQAKKAGGDTVRFFDPAVEQAMAQSFALRQDLARAIDAGELRLYAQPQVDAQRRVVGAELLLRWQRPDGRMVSPGQFIPLAEESGLIVRIDRWVRQKAVATLQRWQTQAPLAGLRLAVNVSSRAFEKPDFVEHVLQDLEPLGPLAGRLELEVTESVFLQHLSVAKAQLAQLKATGVTLALDDFGTGFSSLSYLSELPFDVLKIDQSFVARLQHNDRQGRAIVSTIISLGNQLGMVTLAEGVETMGQAAHLSDLGCQQMQGYWFARPMPLDQFEAWVTQGVVFEHEKAF